MFRFYDAISSSTMILHTPLLANYDGHPVHARPRECPKVVGRRYGIPPRHQCLSAVQNCMLFMMSGTLY